VRRTLSAIGLGLICLVAAACGGNDSSPPAQSGGSGDGAPSAAGLRVAYASALDPNDIADQFGLQAAKAKVQTLNDDSAVVAGLLRRSIDVGNVDYDAAMKAKATGVPIKVIYVSQTKPEYVFVARPEISSLEQLSGKNVGYHAPGSQTEIFARNLVKEKVPGIYGKVKFVALEESSRRAQAMEAKRLDASSLEAINLAQLRKQGGYHELGTWADLSGSAEKVLGTAWITTEEFYARNKPRLDAFVKAMQGGYDRFYSDKQGWVDLARAKLPDVDQSLLPGVYDVYSKAQMYPRPGTPALTADIFKANDAFFRDLGEWEDPIKDDVIAYDLVNAGSKAGK
jgi:ABC-type nitrate/sulfonate/bicarbonate transport system substrate-binding protein